MGIEKFGMFVEFLPTRTGLVHFSELALGEELNDFDLNDEIDVVLLAVSAVFVHDIDKSDVLISLYHQQLDLDAGRNFRQIQAQPEGSGGWEQWGRY